MPKPIEFSKFYQLVKEVKRGDLSKKEVLTSLIEDYKIGLDSETPYEELGKILCTVSLRGVNEYTGLKEIELICRLKRDVWDYLKIRTGESLEDYLASIMKSHVNNKDLLANLCSKWNVEKEELENNLENLIDYVNEGIIDIIK